MKLNLFDKVCGYIKCYLDKSEITHVGVTYTLVVSTIFVMFPWADILRFVLYPYVPFGVTKDDILDAVLCIPPIIVVIVCYFRWIRHDRWEKIMEAPCFHRRRAPYIGLAIRNVAMMICLLYPYFRDWLFVHVFGIN